MIRIPVEEWAIIILTGSKGSVVFYKHGYEFFGCGLRGQVIIRTAYDAKQHNKEQPSMELSTLLRRTSSAGGIAGALVLSVPEGRIVAELNPDSRFPLASSSRLLVAYAAADAIRSGELAPDRLVGGLALAPHATSNEVYPHLRGVSELELRDVVEVSIGGLDPNYADTLARLLGGWEAVAARVGRLYPGARVSSDVRDPEETSAPLRALAETMRTLALAYRVEPRPWLPVVEGMLRHPYKADGIPPQRVLNAQGGWAEGAIDIGLLGDIVGGQLLAYSVAIAAIRKREVLLTVYDEVERVIRELYRDFFPEPPAAL